MEIRVKGDSVEISGYVNAVERESSPLLAIGNQYFTETIRSGAFASALRENPDVPMLLNHNWDRRIAEGDALDLREDAVGLHVRATVTDPEVVDKARSNRLRGWSFGFVPLSMDSETRENAPEHRNVYKMELHEVSLLDDTRTPAYPATSVYTREGNADKPLAIRTLETGFEMFVDERDAEPSDLSRYRDVIKKLGSI